MRDHRYTPAGGPCLRVRVGGEGPGLLLLHGFASGLDGWPPEELEALARDRRVVALDLPGHGGSDPARPGDATPDRVVALVEAVRREFLGDDPGDWLGYSMGARVALTALAGGVRMRSLLLESPHPGLEADGSRSERVSRDEGWALRFEDEPLPEVLDAWLAQPIFASRASVGPSAATHQRRVRESAHGPSLSIWLREFGSGTMPHAWDALGRAEAPLHVAVGELDERYVALARRVETHAPDVTVTVVDGVGHAPHIEAPGSWGRWVRRSLAATGR